MLNITEKIISDALRYMKVPPPAELPPDSQDSELIETVKQAFINIKNFSTPRLIFGRFNIKKSDSNIEIEGAKFSSKDIARLTSRSDKCYLLAATLGHEVDRQILIAQKKNMLEGLAFDACASVYIDEFIDEFTKNEISKTLNEKEFLTSRFSPGYGDLDMTVTADIIAILNATKRIGLSVTNSFMMTPIKSVTAIIGIATKK